MIKYFLSFLILAAQIDEISFNEWNLFDKHLNQEILIKGFLHQSEDQIYFLTKEASLKSCCLNKKNQIKIELESFNPKFKTKSVITLQGKLVKKNGLKDENDPIYLLKEIVILEKSHQTSQSLIFFGILMLIIFLSFIFQKKVKHHSFDHQKV